jgi:hypothetical protein
VLKNHDDEKFIVRSFDSELFFATGKHHQNDVFLVGLFIAMHARH